MGAPGIAGLSASINDPRYATGIGLVLHAARGAEERMQDLVEAGSNRSRKTFDLKGWFADLF